MRDFIGTCLLGIAGMLLFGCPSEECSVEGFPDCPEGYAAYWTQTLDGELIEGWCLKKGCSDSGDCGSCQFTGEDPCLDYGEHGAEDGYIDWVCDYRFSSDPEDRFCSEVCVF